MTRATLTVHTGDSIPTTVDFNVTDESEVITIVITPTDVQIKTPNKPKLIVTDLQDDAPFRGLFNTMPAGTESATPFGYPGSTEETSMRTFNLANREGVETVGDLLNLTPEAVRLWRNHKDPETVDQIAAMQARVRELRGD